MTLKVSTAPVLAATRTVIWEAGMAACSAVSRTSWRWYRYSSGVGSVSMKRRMLVAAP